MEAAKPALAGDPAQPAAGSDLPNGNPGQSTSTGSGSGLAKEDDRMTNGVGELNGDDAVEDVDDVDELNDVMEVLTDLTREDYKDAAPVNGGVDALTSVQDVAKVVDREELSPAILAQQKFIKVNERQQALEKRLFSLASRINMVRCRTFGSHIAKEIGLLRSSYEKYLPAPAPQFTMPPLATLTPPAQLAAIQAPTPPTPTSMGGQLVQQPQQLSSSVPPVPFSPLISLSAAFQQQKQQQQQGQLGGMPMPIPLVPPQLQLQSLQPSQAPQLPPTQLPSQPLALTEVKDEPVNPLLQPPQPLETEQQHAGTKRKVKKTKKLQLAEAAAAASAAAAKAEAAFPPAPSEEEKQQFSETLGKLNVNLRHLIQSYDSEATESSSGGESCDEFEGYDPDAVKTVPLRKRAKFSWLKNRAGIASRWTWLTAQIADLEYRIRQQTELYRQIRSMKGPLFLGEPQQPQQSAATVPNVNRQSIFTLTEESGKRVVVKGPSDPLPQPEEAVCARTRPIKSIKKRCVMSTNGFYRVSSRAAKESNVSCGCLRPQFTCAICYGRSNHSLAPDPVFHDRSKTLALIDHSYHQVLSRPSSDVPVEVALSQKLKNRSWMLEVGGALGEQPPPTALAQTAVPDKSKSEKKEGPRVLSKYMRKKLDERRRQKELMGEDGADVEEEYFLSKLKKKKNKEGKTKKRKKSVTVSHHSDGVAISDIHQDYEDGDDEGSRHERQQQPSVSSHLATMEQIRRKRETSFDIDNIVIPYSTMASARVEKLKYKEIQTPYWRETVDGQDQDTERKADVNDENISESVFIVRHKKAELEEQARWKTLAGGGSGGQRGAAAAAAAAAAASSGAGAASSSQRSQRRQDSRQSADGGSGCNTPVDPMSPVELEVTTRPSTPEGAEPPTPTSSASATPSSIRNRRRTSSVTRLSRDRNPSEDMSNPSRCTTPINEVPPYEPRHFPLSEATYDSMVNNTEAATAVFIGQQPPKQTLVKPSTSSRRVSLSATPQVVISRLRISRDSSIDEEVVDSDEVESDIEEVEEEMLEDEELDEEDPEWMEDEDDPEYKPSADD